MAYASVAELQTLLQIGQPTQLQNDAMKRALEAAADEIDWELGYTAAAPAPDPPPPLVAGVNLDRAIEHWKQWQSPYGFGLLAIADQPVTVRLDGWSRHAAKLKPLKTAWGVA